MGHSSEEPAIAQVAGASALLLSPSPISLSFSPPTQPLSLFQPPFKATSQVLEDSSERTGFFTAQARMALQGLENRGHVLSVQWELN